MITTGQTSESDRVFVSEEEHLPQVAYRSVETVQVAVAVAVGFAVAEVGVAVEFEVAVECAAAAAVDKQAAKASVFGTKVMMSQIAAQGCEDHVSQETVDNSYKQTVEIEV